MKNKSFLEILNPRTENNLLFCEYTFGGEKFSHVFTFQNKVDLRDPPIDRMAKWIAITSSTYLNNVSYFLEIRTEFSLSQQEVEFFEKLIFFGMAEFRYVNLIDIGTRTNIIPANIYNAKSLSSFKLSKDLLGALLLNGGGKDGSVSAWLLKENNIPFDWFMLNTSVAQDNLALATGFDTVKTKRLLDQSRLNRKYRGHRPTSASIAFVGALTAYINGYKDIIASNEASANESNLELNGVTINHQYSKSYEFEKDLNKLFEFFGIQVRYFSLLRPMHELQISKLMQNLPSSWLKVMVSCNKGFKRGEWCMDCAKCAFVSLIIAATNPKILMDMFDFNPLLEPTLKQHIIDLINPLEQKPLECVGTLEECQIAAKMILNSELGESLPSDFRELLTQYSLVIEYINISDYFKTFGSEYFIPKEYLSALELAKKTII